MPLHFSEITHPEPSFINVKEDLVIECMLEHIQSPLLTKNQVFLRVAMNRYTLDLAIAHQELIFHNFPDLIYRDIFSSDLLNFLLDKFG